MLSLRPVALVLVLLSSCALAHICLLFPEQRGGANIVGPGSPSCFWPQAPCGKKPAQSPAITLRAGTTFNVLLQQNLNHYNPGWPGFIDVAYGVGTNQTSDSDFTILAQIPDYWAHLQASQTNFSIPITVPNIDCPHCTLRVRYHPNKPEEPIFHNCADITIASNPLPKPPGRIVAATRNGPSHQAYNSQTFTIIDPTTGTLRPLSSSPNLLIRNAASIPSSSLPSSSSPSFSSSQVATSMSLSQGLTTARDGKLYWVGSTEKDSLANRPPSTLFSADPSTGAVLSSVPIQNPQNLRQWTSLSRSTSLPSPFLIVGIFPQDGNYVFQPFFLFANGSTKPAAPSSAVQDTFVNVFWADFSDCNQQLYLLSGDENSLETLDVAMFVFDIKNNSTSMVMVDNSKYTISTVQVVGCEVYSLSPGLLTTPTAQWSLVSINPSTGSVSPVFGMGEPNGFFTHYYGGGIYGQSPYHSDRPAFYHIFQRSNDLSFVLGLVDLNSSSLIPVDLNLGLNSFTSLSAVTYVN